MGAWDMGSFDNDSAMDFLDILESSPEGEGSDEEPGRDALLVMTLLRAADPKDGADVDAATEGLAAAELIAAINGKPLEGLEDTLESCESLAEWIATGEISFRGKKQIVELSQKAINRVLTSELADLWADTDDHAAWIATVKDLQERLG